LLLLLLLLLLLRPCRDLLPRSLAHKLLSRAPFRGIPRALRVALARHVLPIDGEAKRRALADLALDPDRALVRLDDALHARQADALAGHRLHGGTLASPEDEEDLVEVLGFDADAGVAHVELDL